MTNEELWKAVLGQIELSISKANFVTWFKNTTITQNQNGIVTIGVPNGFAKEWLENKYNHYILKALKGFDEHIHEIHCSLTPEKPTSLSIDSIKTTTSPKSFQPTDGFVRKKIIEKPSFGIAPHETPVFHEANLNSR